MNVTLRPYQEKAISDLREQYLRGKRAPVLVMPTGSGKTVIFSRVAEMAQKKGNSVYILVHRQELLLQSSRHLSSLGLKHGRIAPGHTMTKDSIQIASVQTLVRRLKYYKEPDLIIVDECHHATAGSWRKIISAYPHAKLFGVTATPCRLDGVGLGKSSGGVFDSLIYGPSLRELIDSGYLSQPIVYAPPSDLDMTGLKLRAGDYEKAETEKRVDKPTITGSAVEHYTRLCNNAPACVFCASVAHAQHVAEQFRAAGYKALSIDGNMCDADRKEAIDKLGDGRIQILTACDIVSEGTDIPIVGVIILLRPTVSTGLYLQQCGRGLRLYPGKENTIILDHVGNCLRHGLPDEDREWSLEGEKKRKKKKKEQEEADVKIKQCPICYVVHEPAYICPNCGYIYKANGKQLEETEGELTQVTPNDVKAKRKEVAMARTYEELQQIGKQRGYKSGWAWQVWKARETKLRTTVSAKG